MAADTHVCGLHRMGTIRPRRSLRPGTRRRASHDGLERAIDQLVDGTILAGAEIRLCPLPLAVQTRSCRDRDKPIIYYPRGAVLADFVCARLGVQYRSKLDQEIVSLRPLFHKMRASRAGHYLNVPVRAAGAAVIVGPPVWRAIKWIFASREDTNYTYELTELSHTYLAHAVSTVAGCSFEDAKGYLDEPLNDNELGLHVAASLQIYSSTADKRVQFARRLGWYAVVRATKPALVVETGVDKGLGAVLLAAALLKNGIGEYIGTDIVPGAGRLLSGRYASVGKIVYGDSLESLRLIDREIDIFINDSDHSASYEQAEYCLIQEKLSARAIVIGDNSHVTSKLEEWSRANGRRFLFWAEKPRDHWYPGAGIGFSYTS